MSMLIISYVNNLTENHSLQISVVQNTKV